MTLGEFLKRERIKRLMTQDEIAKMCKVGVSLFSHWEKGDRQPSMKSLRKIAKGLDIDPKILAAIILGDDTEVRQGREEGATDGP